MTIVGPVWVMVGCRQGHLVKCFYFDWTGLVCALYSSASKFSEWLHAHYRWPHSIVHNVLAQLGPYVFIWHACCHGFFGEWQEKAQKLGGGFPYFFDGSSFQIAQISVGMTLYRHHHHVETFCVPWKKVLKLSVCHGRKLSENKYFPSPLSCREFFPLDSVCE